MDAGEDCVFTQPGPEAEVESIHIVIHLRVAQVR